MEWRRGPQKLLLYVLYLIINTGSGYMCCYIVLYSFFFNMTKIFYNANRQKLEKEMATHFSILAQEISWTEEPGGLQSMESQESDMTQQLTNNNGKNKRFPLSNSYEIFWLKENVRNLFSGKLFKAFIVHSFIYLFLPSAC